ncbi:hypothetical protein [Mucilaginibacter kameinonensis]|uniref:hypothetical protein n=1 Tax=Mucilaginibacter kameinonensis TaxID=452286 RepID=UPI000EF7A56B|nr:hypothetical protein [Mucilaginibacter kameinonensis]
MKSKQLMFFATFDDIKGIIEDVEAAEHLKSYLTGSFETEDRVEYRSLLSVPDLGKTDKGDWMTSNNYLIIPRGASLKVEIVPQRKGGVRYYVSQPLNSESIVIKFGGIYTSKPNVLIAGRMGTVSQEAFSLRLYNLFASKIKKKFKKKIGMFYFGPEATLLLKDGWRLVTNEQAPRESDFVYE